MSPEAATIVDELIVATLGDRDERKRLQYHSTKERRDSAQAALVAYITTLESDVAKYKKLYADYAKWLVNR